MTKPKPSRLHMAELVLDSVLTLLVDKGLMTRDEVQQQIIKQVSEPDYGTERGKLKDQR